MSASSQPQYESPEAAYVFEALESRKATYRHLEFTSGEGTLEELRVFLYELRIIHEALQRLRDQQENDYYRELQREALDAMGIIEKSRVLWCAECNAEFAPTLVN